MLEQELAYFRKMQNEFRAKNPSGGYIVIKGEEVLGCWLNRTDALQQGVAKWGSVPFLVKNIDDDLTNSGLNYSRKLNFLHAAPDF